uniref:Cysteine and histidine-rich domain-containing protein 1 n=1 Tax=Anisakis simplex TaxID=6269 RepID=A0A0M3JQX9_ANISI
LKFINGVTSQRWGRNCDIVTIKDVDKSSTQKKIMQVFPHFFIPSPDDFNKHLWSSVPSRNYYNRETLVKIVFSCKFVNSMHEDDLICDISLIDSCVYHPGPAYFHDAYKIWNCCNKKSTDFGTWLSFKGCTRGKHNAEKPAEDTKPIKTQTQIRPEAPEEVIVWNGLNQPAARDEKPRKMATITLEATEAALKAIEAHRTLDEGDGCNLQLGMSCNNAGCNKVYQGEESNKEVCVYHPGTAVFHEGMKYWSCCQKKTSDFSTFLDQKGCTKGMHCWLKHERVDKIREDWFCRGGYIHLNIYCKGSLPDKCCVQSDGLVLHAKVVHGFGTKETDLNYELFGEIDVPNCKVIVGERKLEMVLKKVGVEGWPRLTYESPSQTSEQC